MVAIVTGDARGIGGQIAMAFAAEGADIVIADQLDEAVAAPVAASIGASGRRSMFVHTDVSDEYQVRAMVDRAIAVFGQVDILVNDAGTFSQLAFDQIDVAEFDRVLGVNLRGVFLCSRFAIVGMLERGSGIVIHRVAAGTDRRWVSDSRETHRWDRDGALQRQQGRSDRLDQGACPRGVDQRASGSTRSRRGRFSRI